MGRNKVRFIVMLMMIASCCVAGIALVPANLTGVVAVGLVLTGWIFWSGVITIRTTVWRANYPEVDRTQIAGRLASVQAIVLAISAVLIDGPRRILATGGARHPDRARARVHGSLRGRPWPPRIPAFPLLAVFGVVGALIYARVRLRGQSRLARAERAGARQTAPPSTPFPP